MARRESQGLQIAMILFVITTLILLVTTYLFWSQSQKLLAESEKNLSDFQNADSALRTSETQNGELKLSLGFQPGDDFNAVKVTLDEDKAVYGQGLPEEQQNFRDIASHLTKRIQALTKDLSDATGREQALIAEKNQIREESDKIVNDARTAESKAATDLEGERASYEESRNTLNAQRAELAKNIDSLKRELTQLKAETAKQVEEVRQLLSQKEQILADRNIQIQTLTGKPYPDVVDGKITGVVASTRTVWINAGDADGLRPRITFSVYDADENDMASATQKASIEVTKILGPHVAEAKIIEDDYDYTNPILPGDFIYSPLWSPGMRMGFALLGRMDIDGDALDDRDLIRNLINMNGGQVDAEDLDGKVKGEITVQTRYLIIGDITLGESEGATANPALKPMLDAAARLGVEQMSVDKLVRSMGYTRRVHTVPFNGTARPEDFMARPPEGGPRRSTESTLFRDRRRSPAAQPKSSRGAY